MICVMPIGQRDDTAQGMPVRRIDGRIAPNERGAQLPQGLLTGSWGCALTGRRVLGQALACWLVLACFLAATATPSRRRSLCLNYLPRCSAKRVLLRVLARTVHGCRRLPDRKIPTRKAETRHVRYSHRCHPVTAEIQGNSCLPARRLPRLILCIVYLLVKYIKNSEAFVGRDESTTHEAPAVEHQQGDVPRRGFSSMVRSEERDPACAVRHAQMARSCVVAGSVRRPSSTTSTSSRRTVP